MKNLLLLLIGLATILMNKVYCETSHHELVPSCEQSSDTCESAYESLMAWYQKMELKHRAQLEYLQNGIKYYRELKKYMPTDPENLWIGEKLEEQILLLSNMEEEIQTKAKFIFKNNFPSKEMYELQKLLNRYQEILFG